MRSERSVPSNGVINKALVTTSHVNHASDTGTSSHHQDVTSPLMVRSKNSDSCVQGKEPVVLNEYVEMVEVASAPHSNDCIMYMRLSTHSGKRFFDDWESSEVGDSGLNSDRGWLVRRGGGSVEACSYARVTGLFTLSMSQEQ